MKKYTNPIIKFNMDEYGRTADPYVLRCNDKYYHCYIKPDGVYLTETDELCDIGKGREIRIFKNIPKATEWYAPELHKIGGKWYVYGSPTVDGENMHIMSVLEFDGESPMGEYEYKGAIRGLENKWSIDGTVFEYEDKTWFVWATCGKLCMAEMPDPYSIKDETFELAKSGELDFERRDGNIIEGPAVIKKGDKIHIVYSANNSKGDEYCLGLLTFCGGDITDCTSWKKSENAVFEKTDDIFGPGHCSFTTVTENGKDEGYIVYHANLKSGSGWFGRCVWIQRFGWNSANMPVFGKPMRVPAQG